MAPGSAAARTLCRLSPARRIGLPTKKSTKPAGLATATAPSRGSFRHAVHVYSHAGVAGRRPLFNLAAAALGQAAGAGAGGPLQHITTVRTLPYAADDLFHIIADVDAYAQFLPHCTASRVTHWRTTQPAPATATATASGPPSPPPQRLAARADLTVGWGPLQQTYSSRVYCVPGHGVVEAVSGRAGAPTLTAAERAEIGLDTAGDDDDSVARRPSTPAAADDDDTFESLVTRWTVTAMPPRAAAGLTAPAPRTRVELHIRFQFRNPLYQIATAQISKEMATKMVDAFEARAAALLAPTARPS